jgi:hypothetical protein
MGFRRLPDKIAGLPNQKSWGEQVKLPHGFQYPYGWLGIWSTTNLPNGSHTVQSIAKDTTGRSSTSPAVAITVEN